MGKTQAASNDSNRELSKPKQIALALFALLKIRAESGWLKVRAPRFIHVVVFTRKKQKKSFVMKVKVQLNFAKVDAKAHRCKTHR